MKILTVTWTVWTLPLLFHGAWFLVLSGLWPLIGVILTQFPEWPPTSFHSWQERKEFVVELDIVESQNYWGIIKQSKKDIKELCLSNTWLNLPLGWHWWWVLGHWTRCGAEPGIMPSAGHHQSINRNELDPATASLSNDHSVSEQTKYSEIDGHYFYPVCTFLR